MPEAIYLFLKPDGALPALNAAAPFKAVVVIESEVTPEWQAQVSDWLVRSGCLYMMAWGRDCGAWDSSVEVANLKLFDFGEIPEDRFVMTTWHEKELLEDVFWFSLRTAVHESVALEQTYIFHIAEEAREAEMLVMLHASQRIDE
jgi:hypothetical protein